MVFDKMDNAFFSQLRFEETHWMYNMMLWIGVCYDGEEMVSLQFVLQVLLQLHYRVSKFKILLAASPTPDCNRGRI
jgi:hypothetical protein